MPAVPAAHTFFIGRRSSGDAIVIARHRLYGIILTLQLRSTDWWLLFASKTRMPSLACCRSPNATFQTHDSAQRRSDYDGTDFQIDIEKVCCGAVASTRGSDPLWLTFLSSQFPMVSLMNKSVLEPTQQIRTMGLTYGAAWGAPVNSRPANGSECSMSLNLQIQTQTARTPYCADPAMNTWLVKDEEVSPC